MRFSLALAMPLFTMVSNIGSSWRIHTARLTVPGSSEVLYPLRSFCSWTASSTVTGMTTERARPSASAAKHDVVSPYSVTSAPGKRAFRRSAETVEFGRTATLPSAPSRSSPG